VDQCLTEMKIKTAATADGLGLSVGACVAFLLIRRR
jgi:hypothetical protein